MHGGRSPLPVAVGSVPADRSPFGVPDMGGSVREMCIPVARDLKAGMGTARGGSWGMVEALAFRSAKREVGGRHATGFAIGLRVRAAPRPR